jgi:hypothetical protein
MKRKELILGTIDDLVADLLFYDRKEDLELPKGEIEAALAAGEITAGEMVARFRAELYEGLG